MCSHHVDIVVKNLEMWDGFQWQYICIRFHDNEHLCLKFLGKGQEALPLTYTSVHKHTIHIRNLSIQQECYDKSHNFCM
jgi:hypothetical protein